LCKATEIDTSLTSGPQKLWEFQTHHLHFSNSCGTIHKFIDFLDWIYLDGLLHKENRNQHAKKFACNPRKSVDYIASIEYCKKKQQESCPNANPAEVISVMSKSHQNRMAHFRNSRKVDSSYHPAHAKKSSRPKSCLPLAKLYK
jgi:hypothetical protein